MQTLGTSAATLLLLLLHSATNSVGLRVQVGKSKRAVTSNADPRNAILEEAIVRKNDCKDDVRSNIDQYSDQSRTLAIDADDTKDFEDPKRAFFLTEYEPQRIRTQKKRKVLTNLRDLTDPATGSERIDSAEPPDARAYYEMTRNGRPNKNIRQDLAAPTFYSKPAERNVEITGSEQSHVPVTRKRTRSDVNKNVEYVYAVQAPSNVEGTRLLKNRSQHSPPLTEEESKYQNVPSTRIVPSRPYTSLPVESRRAKYTAEAIVATTTPWEVNAYTTRPRKRKRNRNRAIENSSSQGNALHAQSSTNTYNFNVSPNAIRDPSNVENRSKSRRLGSLARYDVAPRPFAISKIHSANANEESNARNTETKAEDGIVNRESRGKQSTLNSSKKKSSVESSGSAPKTIVSARDTHKQQISRKELEETVIVPASTEQDVSLDVETSPRTDYKKLPPTSDKAELAKEIGTPEVEEARRDPLRQPAYIDGSPATWNIPPKASLDLEAYKSLNDPILLGQLSNPGSTSIPYATVSPLLANLPLYPIVSSTLGPLRHFDVGTGHSEIPSKSADQAGFGETNGQFRAKKDDSSQALAIATSLQSKRQNRESTLDGYKTHETPDDEDRNEDKFRSEDSRESEESSDRYGEGGEYRKEEAEKYEHGKGEDPVNEESEHKYESSRAKGNDGNREENVGESDGDDGAKGNEEDGNEKFEKGGSTENGEEHRRASGGKGRKGYTSWHEHDKASKGHRDKEQRSNYYDEKDGKEKEEEEEGGYHEEHREGDEGEKKAEFGEKGQHQKGHSTKGQHFVHKKDEFEKKTEFFDEFHEDGEIEKDGEYYEEREKTKGGHEKTSHREEKDHEEKYGKEGKHAKGRHYHENKGHEIGEGQDSYYDREEAHGEKGGQDEGKKWAYKKIDGEGDAGGEEGGDHKSDR